MSVNSCFHMGNLVRDPELKYTQNGKAIGNFTIAVNRKYKDSQGEWKEDASFLDMELFGDNAERFVEQAKKGDGVYVESSVKQDSWTDKESGQKRSRLKFWVNRFVFLEPRRSKKNGGNEPSPPQRAKPAPSRNRTVAPEPELETAELIDEDIPF